MHNLDIKIDSLYTKIINLEFKKAIKTSYGSISVKPTLFVILKFGKLKGIGECAALPFPSYTEETTHTAKHIIEEFIAPAIVKKHFHSIKELTDTFTTIKRNNMAKAAVEMAVWDIYSQIEKKPITELINSTKTSIKSGITFGIYANTNLLIKEISDAVSNGYSRIKLKIDNNTEFIQLEKIRNHFPELMLHFDANSSFRLDNIDFLKKIDQLNPIIIEQPFAVDDLLSHSILQSQINSAVCLDESITSLSDVITAYNLKACKCINIKQSRVGGLINTLKIIEYCKQNSVDLWYGGMYETNIGRAFSLAIASHDSFIYPSDLSASDRYFIKDISLPDFKLNPDSTINTLNKPGLYTSLLTEF